MLSYTVCFTYACMLAFMYDISLMYFVVAVFALNVFEEKKQYCISVTEEIILTISVLA